VDTYFLRQGFRDGSAGFAIATMAGHYVCLKYKKLWRMAHPPKDSVPAAER
jgi:hypothetical protein